MVKIIRVDEVTWEGSTVYRCYNRWQRKAVRSTRRKISGERCQWKCKRGKSPRKSEKCPEMSRKLGGEKFPKYFYKTASHTPSGQQERTCGGKVTVLNGKNIYQLGQGEKAPRGKR